MGLITRFQLIVMVGVALFPVNVFAAAPLELKTPQDRINYAIGVNIVNNFKQQDVEVNLDLVLQGMKDAYAGHELLLNAQELRKAIMQHQSYVRKKLGVRARSATAESNRKASETFLETNKGREGVVTLQSGLQYRIVTGANGRTAREDDTVTYKFRSAHIDGKEFDSSSRSGDFVTVKIRDVAVPGLKEGLMLMPAGSTWQLFIPARLAYGELGRGQSVGPNQAIIYDVELLSIN